MLALFCLLAADALGRSKVDIVYLKNGDRFTGEIKTLDKGKLSLDTKSAGIIEIDWLDIRGIKSPQLFEIETNAGVRYFGTIDTNPEEQKLIIPGVVFETVLDHKSIVLMRQFDETFLDRIRLDIEAGYNFVKANSQAQFTFGLDSGYRTRNYEGRLGISSQINSRSDTQKTVRNDLSLYLNRSFKNKWFVAFISNFQRNDELSLDLRSLYGGALGRRFFQTNRFKLAAFVGTAYARENFVNREAENNMEAVLGVQSTLFKYSRPELDLSVEFLSYPSLTAEGRVRLDLDTRLKYEIVGDLFVGLGFYDNFDSKPPSQTAEKNDFGIRTTIGWTF